MSTRDCAQRLQSRSHRAGALFALVLALFAAGCPRRSQPRPPPPPVEVPPADRAVADQYPSLTELYSGAQGIYRGCSPNGNVCHNARQYPNMSSLGSIALNINRPCNQLQDDPTRIDDWCERVGDRVRVGDSALQLAYIQQLTEPTATAGSRWAIATEGALPAVSADTQLIIERALPDGRTARLVRFGGDRLERDPMRDNVVFVQLAMDDEREAGMLERAGVPGDPDAIQFGDPNRNGTYGASIGAALVLPGHPERSYIIRRLTDPSAGPLMPLANCCFWSKPALRALWCWIASLRPDGSNAMDPIDYAVCPPGPTEDVDYPEPGPMCQSAGVCPVRAHGMIPPDPTWANVYSNILLRRCAGSMCHVDSAAGELDFRSADMAYDGLLRGMTPRVIAGDPAMSLLHVRLTQACEPGDECYRMPLNAAPLPANELTVIEEWIRRGALRDGIITDAGTDAAGTDAARDVVADIATDAATDAAMDAGTGSDVAMDAPAPDVVGPSPDAGVDE